MLYIRIQEIKKEFLRTHYYLLLWRAQEESNPYPFDP